MWQLARWMGGGITPDDIDEMPIGKVMEAQIVMQAISKAEHEAHKPKKGGRKR